MSELVYLLWLELNVGALGVTHVSFAFGSDCAIGRGVGTRECQGSETLKVKVATASAPDVNPPPATSAPSTKSESPETTTTSGGGLSGLAQQIAKAREQIQHTLQSSKLGSPPPSSSGGAVVDDEEMRAENALLTKKIELLETQVKQLTERVTLLEKGSGDAKPTQAAPKPAPVPAKEEDDDDVDLFGSDDEEDNEAAAKLKEQRLAEYAAKKSKSTSGLDYTI